MESQKFSGSEVAVIGMAGLFPNSNDLAHWWEQLRAGKELISFFSDDQLLAAGVDAALLKNPRYVKAGSVLAQDIALFDAGFFGFNPREAEVMDPQHRLFLEIAYQALESAGYASENFKGRIGVFAGQSLPMYLLANVIPNSNVIESLGALQVISSNDKDFLPTRVSYKLNLKGPSVNVQTACSTSLVAVHIACQSLVTGECDLALAGAASLNIHPISGYLHQDGGINSPDGHCRAFDAKGAGTVFGSGVAAVVLKRLADAIADGDAIDAIILGSAVNNDGSLKVGYTAPSVEGQAEAIAEAQAVAGVSADEISYVETHGTGTNLGDPVEVSALTQAFRTSSERNQYCAIGSVKSNMGHLDTVAGLAGLMKTALQLKHKQIVPSISFDEPNPKIDFANSPFYVNTKLQDWKRNGKPLRAGVSSFGIGGTNAHLVLQEPPDAPSLQSSRSSHVLLLSAKTATSLEAATNKLASFLSEHSDVNLADAAYTLQAGRNSHRIRRAILCSTREEAIEALSGRDPQRAWTGTASERRSVFFMFPGQGSQYPDMGRGLYESEPIFRAQVDRCAELLRPHLDRDLREILYPAQVTEDAEALLTQTAIAQPAIFTIEYALAKLWMEYGLEPDAMIGHSIGEYVAACLADVMTLEDALALVAVRGRSMQRMPAGAMTSVSVSETEARKLLSGDLCLAAVNAPNLCVISGPASQVDQLEARLRAGQIGFRRLHTSHAFHSTMMDPILKSFENEFAKITLRAPKIRFLSNLTGTWIRESEAMSAEYWAKHLRHAVRFSDGLGELLKTQDALLLEVGPGQALSTFAKQHAGKGAGHLTLASMKHAQEKRSDVDVMLGALARTWVAGRAVQWTNFYEAERRRRIPLPTYCFDHQRYWLDPPTAAKEPQRQAPESRIAKKGDTADWFWLPSWRRVAPASLLEPSSGDIKLRWCIFLDRLGVGESLARGLRDRGHDVTTVEAGGGYQATPDHFVIDPARADHYQQMWSELSKTGPLPARIVHMWSLGEAARFVIAADRVKRSQTLGFYSLMYLARAAQRSGPAEITVISEGAQEVTGSEDLIPESATMLAACNVLPQEYPQFSARGIDVEMTAYLPEKIAEELLREISAPPTHRYVAHRHGSRWALEFEPVRVDLGQRPGGLRDRGVYLITGGLGNIGLALAEWLAKSVRARVVLIGRTALPARPEWDSWLQNHPETDISSARIRRIRRIESAGGEVLAIAADVSRADSMGAAVQETLRHFGALHGVFHGAGALTEQAFGLIEQLTPEQCEMHFAAKVQGLYAIEQALRNCQPDFCLLMSSISVMLGGIGYYPYSASNFFMDAFARSRNREGRAAWSSINFDSWDFQQGGAAIDDPLAPLALTAQEGMDVFARLLAHPGVVQAVVSVGDLNARMNRWAPIKPSVLPGPSQSKESEGAPVPTSSHARPELQNAYVAPRNDLEEALVNIWQGLLGINGIGIHDNFFDLGGHSLLATQVLSRVQDTFKVNPPLRSIFESPTVATFCDVVIAADANRGRVQKIAALLKKVENMSAEDVAQALQKSAEQRELAV
ncbi:MAG TPA: SDR family NAD(P)-dependent oxidoreductase [Verrucomicrobiae bacterium]|nr:SDR family NAD(P)-dependent oxidoreductase [Verrucomicrobiae bacterium]